MSTITPGQQAPQPQVPQQGAIQQGSIQQQLRAAGPPEAWEPLLRVARLVSRPLERFVSIEAASGILLLVAAAIALGWANSPWASSYEQLWHTPLGVRVGSFSFERSLEWFVNDVLMVIFFFVVGLEIRRELHHGELSEWRRASLPVAAALGGMLAPALIYLALAGAPQTRAGWGVPMATDIAFALGVLTLLAKRAPPALRVLLLALAVIDDLGAIVVIALFYTAAISGSGLLIGALGVVGILGLQRLGVRSKFAYVVPGMVVWAGVYAAGVHPTLAGVVVGLLTPVRAWLGVEGFVAGTRQELEQLSPSNSAAPTPHVLVEALHQIDVARREAISPAGSLIHRLHPWVAFGIMPVFALANAGVVIRPHALDAPASWSVFNAVMLALVVGKPLGVVAASWFSLRLGIARLPLGLSMRHLFVLGMVAGIGFTMALFVAQLAFHDAGLLAAAKLGVLCASGAAALLGLGLGRTIADTAEGSRGARSVDEAESSTQL